jgi:hypothetical protein
MTGLLVVGTVAVIVGVLILLGAPGLFRPLVTYKIYFDNAAGIKLGAPVLLAGRKIGQVQRLYSPVSQDKTSGRRKRPPKFGHRMRKPVPARPTANQNSKSASMSRSTRPRWSTAMRTPV